VWEK
jgi:hypothetical protein